MSALNAGHRRPGGRLRGARKECARRGGARPAGTIGIADYFLACSARSTTQADTITDAVRVALRAEGVRPRHSEGSAESGWLLLDYGDIVVHVFLEATRAFYASPSALARRTLTDRRRLTAGGSLYFAILHCSVAREGQRGSLTRVLISVSARLACGCGLPNPSTPRWAPVLVPRLARNSTPPS